jgi:hypothetical protein
MSSAALADAREALAYWEHRERRLPRLALRRRREAREMAARWHGRVVEAERELYGRGLVGALLLMTTEQRLPERARHAGRRLAHRAAQAAVLATALVVSVVLAVAATAAAVVAEALASIA